MTRVTAETTSSTTNPPASMLPPDISAEGHVCPFCGLTREITEGFDPSTPCPRCTLSDNSNTRNATKARVGPWYVRQVRNPWAPGMRFETLLALVKRQQVTRDSIVRGPTTHQLWKRACEVKGLSREFGVCYSCGGEITTQSNLCQHCNRLQEPPANPDVLVETRECASVPPSLQPIPQPTPPPSALKRAPEPLDVTIGGNEADEAPRIDISTRPLPDPDEMLSATDDGSELARKLTSRPPVRQPGTLPTRGTGRPPAPPAPTAPMGSTPKGNGDAPSSPSTPATPRPPRVNLRPHLPGTDDALLTPQELATAFQLDFKPEDQPKRRSRKAMVLLVLILLAVAAGVLFYLRPDWRRKSSDWTNQQYQAARTYIQSKTAPKPTLPATRPALVVPELPRHEPINIVPPAPSASPATMPTVAVSEAPLAPKPAAARVATDVEPAAPVAAAAPAPVPTPTPAAVVAPKIESPAPTAATPAVPPAPAAPSPTPAASLPPAIEVVDPPAPAPKVEKPAEPELTPYMQSKVLWGKAIDAEINQDYVEAVKCYEQIKKLPDEYHQNDLELRLARAKRLAK